MNRLTHRKKKINIPKRGQYILRKRRKTKYVKKPILNNRIQAIELTMFELDVLYNVVIVFELITLGVLAFNSNKIGVIYSLLTLIVASIFSIAIKNEGGTNGQLKKESATVIFFLSMIPLIYPGMANAVMVAGAGGLMAIMECIIADVINNKN